MRARIVLLPVGGENMVNAAANDVSSTRVEDRKESGRLLAIDMGAKRVGVAVSDELRMTVRPVTTIERRSWKKLLVSINEQIEALEARGLVLGLPLNIDGSEGPAAVEARQIAAKFELSLKIPVYLQDERLTSEEAKSRLHDIQKREQAGDIDSAAAAIILQDFIDRQQSRRADSD
jgi:putative Holliday junction resolvase